MANRFSDLSKNKIALIQSLLQKDEIVKCLVSTDENFLSYDISDFDRTSLVYKNIFPYAHSPNIEDKPKSMICMSFDYRPYRNGQTFKIGSINYYVITHYSLMSTDEGLRTDYLIGEIDEEINLSRLVGISKMLFDGMKDMQIDSKGNWIGTQIKYKSTEFN